MKTRITLFAGALLMAITVGLGALGSHLLKATLETTGRFGTFELAVRYLFIHSSGLLILGALMDKRPRLFIAAVLLLAGMIFFSGSLLMLAFTNRGPWGAVTPVGGTLFVAGWLVAAWVVVRR